jgi:hypothetical protein
MPSVLRSATTCFEVTTDLVSNDTDCVKRLLAIVDFGLFPEFRDRSVEVIPSPHWDSLRCLCVAAFEPRLNRAPFESRPNSLWAEVVLTLHKDSRRHFIFDRFRA